MEAITWALTEIYLLETLRKVEELRCCKQSLLLCFSLVAERFPQDWFAADAEMFGP